MITVGSSLMLDFYWKKTKRKRIWNCK